jgi:hypothetical protein
LHFVGLKFQFSAGLGEISVSARAAITVIALSLMSAFVFFSASADAAPINSQCAGVLERYQSGAIPKTFIPLRRHSALYVYRRSDGDCGWGYGNNYATAGEARAAAYRKCKEFEKKRQVVVGCTLIGTDGRVLASAKRFAPDFTIVVPTPPKTPVAQTPPGDKWLPGEPRRIGFVRPVRQPGVSCLWHGADADRRQCEDYYCIRPAKEGRPVNPYWCSHLKR